ASCAAGGRAATSAAGTTAAGTTTAAARTRRAGRTGGERTAPNRGIKDHLGKARLDNRAIAAIALHDHRNIPEIGDVRGVSFDAIFEVAERTVGRRVVVRKIAEPGR